MKLGWLNDYTWQERPGGAQRAVELYLQSAPKDVELVHCPPGQVDTTCDAYLTFLVKRYSNAELAFITFGNKPFIRCGFDWWPTYEPQAQWRDAMVMQSALAIWMSPLHYKRTKALTHVDPKHTVIIPPPLNLDRLNEARESAPAPKTRDTIWFAEWHPAKGPDLAGAWARSNQRHVDMYSPSMPDDVRNMRNIFNPFTHPGGFFPEAGWYERISEYKSFIHTSRVPDAFGYAILEAYALGVETIVTGMTGVESFPDGIADLLTYCTMDAVQDFWSTIARAL